MKKYHILLLTHLKCPLKVHFGVFFIKLYNCSMFIKKKRIDKPLTRYDTKSMNTNFDIGKLHKLPHDI